MFKYQFIGICPGIDFSQYFNNISDYVFKVSPGAEKIVLITKCIGTKKLHPFAKSLIYKKKKSIRPSMGHLGIPYIFTYSSDPCPLYTTDCWQLNKWLKPRSHCADLEAPISTI